MYNVICQCWYLEHDTVQTLHLSEQDRLLFIYKNQNRIAVGQKPSHKFSIVVAQPTYNILLTHQPNHGVDVPRGQEYIETRFIGGGDGRSRSGRSGRRYFPLEVPRRSAEVPQTKPDRMAELLKEIYAMTSGDVALDETLDAAGKLLKKIEAML